jgi:predicted dinucleotide-utilizing enzyme
VKKPRINRSREVNKEDDALRQRIAEKAYELYQQRGHAHGSDLDDWLEAERQVLSEAASQTKMNSKTLSSRRRRSKEKRTS